MTTFASFSTSYLPAALQVPAKKFSYRFLLSLCLFFLILFSRMLNYTGVSVFILFFINVAFCADIFLRCACKDLLRVHGSFAVLISLSVLSGFIYCALNTFLTRPLAGPYISLEVYVSFLLTLALWAQYRMTRGQERVDIFIKKLDDFLPKSGRICHMDKSYMIFVDELKIGDRVRVYPGERIPCDGFIQSGTSSIDEQLISGNMLATAKQPGDAVYAGTLNKTGQLEIEVSAPLSSSVVMGVLNAIKQNEQRHTQVKDPLEQAAPWLVFMLLGAGIGGYMWALHTYTASDWLHQTGILWFILSLGCPAAWLFSAIFPRLFVRRGAERLGVVINNIDTLQRFVQADTIFLDKTGTVTVGDLRIGRLVPAPRVLEAQLLEALAYAEQQVDGPFAQAVHLFISSKNIPMQKVKSTEIFPGKGVRVQIKKDTILAGKAAWLRDQKLAVPTIQTGDETVVFVARNNQYLGYVTLTDCLREGAKQTVEFLKNKHKEVILISGDTESSVQAVANQLGITKFNFSVLPKTKAEIITNLRNLGKQVIMIGDGFNDILALLKADGGIVFASEKNLYNHWVDMVIKRQDLFALTDLFTINKRLHYTIWSNMFLSVIGQGGLIAWIGWHSPQGSGWQILLGGSLGVIMCLLIHSMRLLRIK